MTSSNSFKKISTGSVKVNELNILVHLNLTHHLRYNPWTTLEFEDINLDRCPDESDEEWDVCPLSQIAKLMNKYEVQIPVFTESDLADVFSFSGGPYKFKV